MTRKYVLDIMWWWRTDTSVIQNVLKGHINDLVFSANFASNIPSLIHHIIHHLELTTTFSPITDTFTTHSCGIRMTFVIIAYVVPCVI